MSSHFQAPKITRTSFGLKGVKISQFPEGAGLFRRVFYLNSKMQVVNNNLKKMTQ